MCTELLQMQPIRGPCGDWSALPVGAQRREQQLKFSVTLRCAGHYIDKKCPFTGNVSIRGRILSGKHLPSAAAGRRAQGAAPLSSAGHDVPQWWPAHLGVAFLRRRREVHEDEPHHHRAQGLPALREEVRQVRKSAAPDGLERSPAGVGVLLARRLPAKGRGEAGGKGDGVAQLREAPSWSLGLATHSGSLGTASNSKAGGIAGPAAAAVAVMAAAAAVAKAVACQQELFAAHGGAPGPSVLPAGPPCQMRTWGFGNWAAAASRRVERRQPVELWEQVLLMGLRRGTMSRSGGLGMLFVPRAPPSTLVAWVGPGDRSFAACGRAVGLQQRLWRIAGVRVRRAAFRAGSLGRRPWVHSCAAAGAAETPLVVHGLALGGAAASGWGWGGASQGLGVLLSAAFQGVVRR